MFYTLIRDWVTEVYTLVKMQRIYAQGLHTSKCVDYTSKEIISKYPTPANDVNIKVFMRILTDISNSL